MKPETLRFNIVSRIAPIFILLFLRAFPLFAQTGGAGIAPPKMAPPSPDVAALFKFSEFPVTLYTGLPSVNIPVFEIKLKEITVPVTLQYHTGGTKVDEVSSSVGMNWSLNAGGSINALTRGKDDLGNGYITYPFTQEIYSGLGVYNNNLPEGGPSYNWCLSVMNGLNDPELDMFSFSAPDISGKFFLDEDGDVHTSPVMPIKVLVRNGLRIISEKGIIYTFNGGENTYSAAGGTNINYYLTQITTPSKDTVNFIYEALNYAYQDYLGETRVQYLSGYRDPELLAQAGDVVTRGAFFDSSHVYGSRIKSIICTNGAKINFNYATVPRKDLPGTNALADISLYYKTRFIKKFVLQQEYKGDTGSPDNCRLWLSQVYEEGVGGIKTAPYKFIYNPKNLPKRLSNGQDHWGYANGRSGASRLPRNKDYWPDDLMGVDKSPDTSYSQAGLMTSLTYPTGGSTSFTYEPNDIWIDNEQTITKTDVIEGVYGSPFTVSQRTFVVPSGVKSGRIFYNTYVGAPPTGGVGIPDLPADENASGITVIKPNGQTQEFSTRNSNPNGELVNWGPGEYTIVVNTFGDSYNGFFELHYVKADTTYFTGSRIVGGWRIKKLAYKDPFTTSGDKTFRYIYALNDSFPEHSCGILPATKPQYEYLRNLSMRKVYKDPLTGGISEIRLLSCQVAVQSANSLLPLWNDHGHIFYPTVTVFDGENGENGKSVYSFSYASSGGGYYGYPFVPSSNTEWYNGMLLKREDSRKDKDGTYKLVQSTQNKYSVADDSLFWKEMYHKPEPPAHLKGVGASVSMEVAEIADGWRVYPYIFQMNTYHYISAWNHLDTTIVNQYSDQNNQMLQTVTSYDYRNGLSLQPSEIKVDNSRNEKTSIVNTYPSDYKGIAVYDTMVKRNIVAPVVLETHYNNNKLVLRKRTNFSRTAADLYLPANMERALYNNPADTEIVYSRYDEKGNLLEYYSRDGVIHSFLWGYNKSHVVAEITGCGYDKALTYINPAVLAEPDALSLRTELDKIRTGLAATSAMVVSYTHTPLVGVTSVTDPNGKISYYEYDGLNRLKVIKDKDGKILKQYDYQYQVPLTQ